MKYEFGKFRGQAGGRCGCGARVEAPAQCPDCGFCPGTGNHHPESPLGKSVLCPCTCHSKAHYPDWSRESDDYRNEGN